MSITQSNVELRALCELNGLVVIKYSSIYGPAYEVLAANGKERICHGENQQEVLEHAVKYLEGRAVLTGKPIKRSATTANAAGSSSAHEYWVREQEYKKQMAEIELMMKSHYTEQAISLEQQILKDERVRNQPQFAPLYPVIPSRFELLEERPGAIRRPKGFEPEEKK